MQFANYAFIVIMSVLKGYMYCKDNYGNAYL